MRKTNTRFWSAVLLITGTLHGTVLRGEESAGAEDSTLGPQPLIVNHRGETWLPAHPNTAFLRPSQPPMAAVGGAGARRDLESNYPAFLLTAGEDWEAMPAVPAPTPLGLESILGKDNRTRVDPTNTFPASAAVMITFRRQGGGGTFLCSGSLIAPDTVSTAGHCVYDLLTGEFFDVESYRVTPGRNGSRQPFGSCTVKTLYTNFRWIARGDLPRGDKWDYGALKLNCTVGNQTGWFGVLATEESLRTQPVTLQGYPADKLYQQWKSTGLIARSSVYRIFYQNDTLGGMSGSGVFIPAITIGGQSCSNCLVGIHAYGVYDDGKPFLTHNHATRINPTVLDFLLEVIAD